MNRFFAKRIEALERAVSETGERRVNRILLTGPDCVPEGMDLDEYLKSIGHDVRDGDFNIVRIIVASPHRDKPQITAPASTPERVEYSAPMLVHPEPIPLPHRRVTIV
ncbi:hypothetical protein [uncultured Enterovirga sp.]|uniref:hypothetical protein n=1 Tax=uncultured Enterovirga sp. TaxID=2026352 RepID=UPI0035CA30DE